MKIVSAVAVLLATASIGWTADLTSGQAKRLSDAATVIRELRDAPDNGIPGNIWDKADCVAVIPGLKKAAFGIGGEMGKGVVSCRSGAAWSAPVFIELEKGSIGFQIGAESVDVVLLAMNRNGIEKMLSNKVNLGADASVAAGPVGRSASAATDGQLTAEILAYSRAKGVFAGINLSGGSLRPDKDANEAAYGASVNTHDVLFSGSAKAPAAAQAFLNTLGNESRATSGVK